MKSGYQVLVLVLVLAGFYLPTQSQLVYNSTTRSSYANCVQLVANRLRFEWSIDSVGQRIFGLNMSFCSFVIILPLY